VSATAVLVGAVISFIGVLIGVSRANEQAKRAADAATESAAAATKAAAASEVGAQAARDAVAVEERSAGAAERAADAAFASAEASDRSARSAATQAESDSRAHRYQTAAEQLGHATAAVRLAGAYAMATLADDWPEQRQTCIDVLCAYLRMPWQPEGPDGPGERQVRMAIIAVIDVHVKDGALNNWGDLEFDLSGARLPSFKLSGGHISTNPRFDDCVFTERCHLENMSFEMGASFRRVQFEQGYHFGFVEFGGLFDLIGVVIPAGVTTDFFVKQIPANARLSFSDSSISGNMRVNLMSSSVEQGWVMVGNLKVEPTGSARIAVMPEPGPVGGIYPIVTTQSDARPVGLMVIEPITWGSGLV